MKVYTNINTLKKVKRLFDEIGLSMVFDVEAKGKNGKEKESKATTGSVINALIEDDKLIEFLQIITKDTKTDFAKMEAEEAGGLINSFFTGLAGFLPDFLKETLSAGMRQRISS